MKKMFLKSAVLAMVGVGLMAGSALATTVSLSFGGNYTLSDKNGTNFLEIVHFWNPYNTAYSGGITWSEPTTDALFGDSGVEYIKLADLILDEQNPYSFNPQTYDNGFEVYDDNGDLLFSADLTAVELDTVNSGGLINSEFVLNLTDITAGSSYAAGTSTIVDSFLSADPGAATSITLQFNGDLASAITNDNNLDSVTSTYSGTAAPVPEPATMLLFGTGFAGLAGVARRKKVKES